MDANQSSFSMATLTKLISSTLAAWIAHLASRLVAPFTLVASDRPIAGGSAWVDASAGDGYHQPPKKIFLPDLLARWPFPRRLNQYYSKVNAESLAWVESFSLSSKAQHTINRGQFSLLSCLGHPIAREEHARSVCDFMNLAFLIDDDSDGSEEGEVRKQKDAIMDALRHPDKPRPKGEWVCGEMARQFWKRTIRNASVQSQKRFIASMDDNLESLAQQAIDRSQHHIRDIQSYIDVRRMTAGARTVFALLELDLNIPDEVISHPTIEDMTIASMDMICHSNDIASYNVEQARGDDSHNIVTIVMHELDTDVNGAMLWVADRHTKLEKKFLEALAAIPQWGEPIDSQVRQYCEGLGNWVRANDDWNFESGRYFGANGPEILRKRWISLIGRKTT
ncbi:terpenoid synthase [Suillus ampliporus]|nr:terpenoid synthase [Suillus ampliporus]